MSKPGLILHHILTPSMASPSGLSGKTQRKLHPVWHLPFPLTLTSPSYEGLKQFLSVYYKRIILKYKHMILHTWCLGLQFALSPPKLSSTRTFSRGNTSGKTKQNTLNNSSNGNNNGNTFQSILRASDHKIITEGINAQFLENRGP